MKYSRVREENGNARAVSGSTDVIAFSSALTRTEGPSAGCRMRQGGLRDSIRMTRYRELTYFSPVAGGRTRDPRVSHARPIEEFTRHRVSGTVAPPCADSIADS